MAMKCTPAPATGTHPTVTVVDVNGNTVTGNAAYSPKRTCGGCHYPDAGGYCKTQDTSYDDYETGTATVQSAHGRLDANDLMQVDYNNVTSPAHGISTNYHAQMGRNEPWTDTQRLFGVPGSIVEQHFFSSTPGMWGRFCPPSNRQVDSTQVTDFTTDPTYAHGVEAGPSEWEKTCGLCHIGGGSLEYDRNMNPYSPSSPNGDRYIWRWTHIAEDGQTVVPGKLVDITADTETLYTGELSASNYAEVDCLMCHMQAVPMAAWYKSWGCATGGVAGPMFNPQCSSAADPRFGYATGTYYDIFNRNIALYNGWYANAATAGLGVTINPQTGVLTGTTPAQIAGSSILYTPQSANCSQCHARNEDTLPLPGMAVFKTGYGNAWTIHNADTWYDADVNGPNQKQWFEFGCKTGEGKRSQKTGDGLSTAWGGNLFGGLCGMCNMFAQEMGGTWGNPWSSTVPNACSNPLLKQACQAMAAKDSNGNYLMGPLVNMMNPTASQTNLIPGKMPDADVHDVAMTTGPTSAVAPVGMPQPQLDANGKAVPTGIQCATCHYTISGNIPAADPYGMGTLAAETVMTIDHQFAKGWSKLEHAKDNLDGTVTCESCHVDQNHPNMVNGKVNGITVPIPTHSEFPALHIANIDCRTCHIPSVYNKPGRLKYRDWSVGRFRGINRNILDWKADLLTGSWDPTPLIRAWVQTPDGIKIQAVEFSIDQIWADKYVDGSGGLNNGPATINPGTSGAIRYEPAMTRDIGAAAQIVEGKFAGTSTPIRLNGANEFPPFDGFIEADAMAISTKAQLDAMVAELTTPTGSGATLHKTFSDPKLRMAMPMFDPSHGIPPAEFALGYTAPGQPADSGCLMCHSTSQNADPNYSSKSIGFFDGTFELLKDPLSQMAGYDCDQLCGMFSSAQYNDCTTPDPAAGPGMMAPQCRNYVGGNLFPGLGMSMDGIDLLQMFMVQEGAYYNQGASGCNPMFKIFDPTDGTGWVENCSTSGTFAAGTANYAKMYSRNMVRQSWQRNLQQTQYNGNNVVVWPIAMQPNPDTNQPAPWDQATICIDPTSPNPMAPNMRTCQNGDMIMTAVNMNQFLGFSPTYLAEIENPAITGYTKPVATISATAQYLTATIDGSSSICTGSNCTYSWTFGDGGTSAIATPGAHTYATGGTYTIGLTVSDGVYSSAAAKSLTVTKQLAAPTVSGSTSVNNMAVTLTDASHSNNNPATPVTVTVNWGDGSALATGTAPVGAFPVHTYTTAGSYNITQSATDSGLSASATYTVTVPGTHTISGTIANASNVPLSGAAVYLTNSAGTVIIQQVTTASNGTYTMSKVTAGSYMVVPKMTGKTMSPAYNKVTVSGSNLTGVNFTSAP